MHKVNINLLRDEAQRLLKEEVELLEQIKNTPNLLTEIEKGSAQTLDSSSLSKIIEQLEGEKHKLDSLELVLAVVGTMKAGKSTTINAITGMEVLPNRNRPMTALPTLIRHTHGVTEPRLIFQNTAPVNKLINELSERLPKVSKEKLEDLSSNNDMQVLLAQVKKKQPFVENHIGAEAIFNFLKGLNDLVRLSTAIDVEFPFSEYSRIENLPVIEVEFVHLSQMGHVQGRLTLLDTPGPNEAGQKHLRPMLRDQLQKASAVLAVLDYTQLKSDADNEMRENLEDVSRVTGDRLYALVNRFDQKDRNSDDSDEVRKYVSSNLMKGLIPNDRVFPVSARYAYLASQAKNELALQGCLPSYESHEWVVDFAQLAIGGFRWKDQLNDIETVRSAANYLWKESQFNEPLEKVIQEAYGKAAILAIDSAASKMVELAESAKNFLGVRKQAFKKSVEDIQLQVASLQRDIEFIQAQEKSVSKETESALDDVSKGVQNAGQKAQREILLILDNYFKEGKSIEANRREDQKNSQKRRSRKNKKEFEQDFESSDKPLKFYNRVEAEDLLKRIAKSIDTASNDAERVLRNDIQQQVELFNKKFNGYVNQAKEVINNIKKGMDDFELILHLPDVKELQLDFAIAEVLDDAAQKRKEKQSSSRRKDSVWGKVCGWFDTDDWGWEEYSVNVDVYHVDIKLIKKDVEVSIEKAFRSMEKSVGLTVEARLTEQANSFFTELKEKVEHVRGDLIASMNDRKKSQEDQQLLLSGLAILEKPVPNLLKDSEALLKDVKNLLEQAGTVK